MKPKALSGKQQKAYHDTACIIDVEKVGREGILFLSESIVLAPNATLSKYQLQFRDKIVVSLIRKVESTLNSICLYICNDMH